jgi:hypothetical protein
MKKPDKCIHFNGVMNPCCDAGVNYRQLAGEPELGYGRRLPCVGRLAGPDAKPCDKLRLPTVEEVEADERWVKERMERMGKVRAAIVAHLGGPWKKGTPGASGTIPCPCCGGTVRFSRAGYNGHVHAACSTKDCVRWME